MQYYPIKQLECKHSERVIAKIQAQRQLLEESKALVEPLFRAKYADEFRMYLGTRDPFKFVRFLISDRYNTPSVSASWIKFMEIFYQYEIFEELWADREIITVYDHAVLPGSGILAAAHYIATKCPKKQWHWYGNTSGQTPEKDDTYKLYEAYHNTASWLGHHNHDAEGITSLVELVMEEYDTPMDLFIGDLGIDVGKKFDKQEELHLATNYSQICAAMGILDNGGAMICKMFTFGTHQNLWLLEEIAECFVTMNLCKPTASKGNNAEIYIVAKGFKPAAGRQLYKKLLTIIETNTVGAERPIVGNYLKSLYQAFTKLSQTQISTIKEEIDTFTSCRSDQKALKSKVSEHNKKITEEWFKRVTLQTLHQYDWLHVCNTTAYQPPKQQASNQHHARNR